MLEEKSGLRPALDEQRFSASDIRYVRITVTQAPSGCWASFFEFEVLGKELVEKPANLFDPRLAGVQSPAGFEQSLFAAPPNISYPTCLEATPWGDVFVGVDQNGSLDREKGRGWVVRCRDSDGDGEADQFTAFARMDSPRGLVFDNNTLYVMHPPLLEAFHDDDGDGVADRFEVLVRGLGKDLDFRGADHTCNGVRLGIDGFLYIALGDYGAQKAVARNGREVQLYGGGIIRVRLDGSDMEVVVAGTRNTYDVAIDPFMNLFTCDNTNDGDEWNLRLSHMVPTAHYGYPSLYKNFPAEIMPMMSDFGGGSPTGALFLDEPGFPDEFGRGLYTCQWGWNNVSRHPLQRVGATFTAEKETFIRLPRPTGIAADGQGNLYIASWKGATFNYAGPNVGFVVRVSGLNNTPTPFPRLRDLPDEELLKMMTSPSAVRRLHVQREILRRDPKTMVQGLFTLAARDGALPVRAAALFTLGQVDSSAATKFLLDLAQRDPLRPMALRALADSRRASSVPTKIFSHALADKEPEVRLQAIIALNRLGRKETAEKIFPFVNHTDPAIAQAALRALVAFQAIDTCFAQLDRASARGDEAAIGAALRILGNIHQEKVVAGLIKRVEKPSPFKPQILETLCRLYHREGEWDGSWWGTRPDSSGPYYKPVVWKGTSRIVGVLEKEILDPEFTRFLIVQFQKYKIPDPQISPLPMAAFAADPAIEASLRKKVFQSLVRTSEMDAVRVLAASSDPVMSEMREEFVKDPERGRSVDRFISVAAGGSAAESELAFAVLLQLAADSNNPAKGKAQQALTAWKGVAALDKARAKREGKANEKTITPPSSDKIAAIAYDEVVKRATAAHGDEKRGAQLFETVGCVKCHTVSKDQTVTGPFLGDITTRYSVEELVESILRPNAKIAQGFETTSIQDKDGEVFDGFIVRESGNEVELRNLAGAVVIPKPNIVSRSTRATSIMPEGLADNLAPEDLASILRYLRSLSAK